MPRTFSKKFSIFKSRTTQHYEAKTKICPRCGALIYYKTFSPGRTGCYIFGSVNQRHKCPAAPYEVFYDKTRPRLRQVLEQYQKDGWLPLFEGAIETDILGTWLKGLTFSTPNERKFRIRSSDNVDIDELIYFRISTEHQLLGLRFFDLTKEEFVEVSREID